MSFRFLISRLFKLNFGMALSRAKKAAAKARRPLPFILLDMVWCALRYGAGPADYHLFAFYNLSPAQRKTYVTRSLSNALIKKLNSPASRTLFENKAEFNRRFSPFIGREWLELPCTYEKLQTLLQKSDAFIYKPLDQCCGSGVEKINVSSFQNSQKLFEYLSAKKTGVVEQYLSQHPVLNGLYPAAVNTIRIVTVRIGDTVDIPFTYLRIGNDGKAVDNFNNGGMMSPLNPTTGTVTLPAVDKNSRLFLTHPATGCEIVGFTVPLWDDCLQLAKTAAHVVPDAGYIGWDIALTPDGPVIIEGNSFPGYDIYQMPVHLPDGIGCRDKLIGYLKNGSKPLEKVQPQTKEPKVPV